MKYARYEIVTATLRTNQPMTTRQLADFLGWDEQRVREGLTHAQRLGLVRKIGKRDRSFIYGATQVPGWPNPAPDCKPQTYDTLAERNMDRETLLERLSAEP